MSERKERPRKTCDAFIARAGECERSGEQRGKESRGGREATADDDLTWLGPFLKWRQAVQRHFTWTFRTGLGLSANIYGPAAAGGKLMALA
jgi:hypothetical protein